MKFALLLAASLLLVACGHDAGHGHDMSSTRSVVGDETVLAETRARAAAVGSESAQASDFATLEELVEGDAVAEHEVEHAALLVRYGEYAHAAHALGFLEAYVTQGTVLLCPGHELAHYYVFMRHGNTEEAEAGVETAQQVFHEWEELGAAYDAKYPGVTPFAETVAVVADHLERIESGATTATDAEINSLVAALCVEAP